MPLVRLILVPVLHFPKLSKNACKQKKKTKQQTTKIRSYSNNSVIIQVLELSCTTHRGNIRQLFFHLFPEQWQWHFGVMICAPCLCEKNLPCSHESIIMRNIRITTYILCTEQMSSASAVTLLQVLSPKYSVRTTKGTNQSNLQNILW